MDVQSNDVTPATAAEELTDVFERIEEAAVVEREMLETIVAAVLARGHVLIEDVPGTGKTVTARILAEALGLEFTRIQFTPDMLPTDVTGSTVYDEHAAEFSFVEGPVFSNIVLADEINRAPPKTQAALLEAMEERQVSADGETYDLPQPFVVVATQNPIEQEGTFRLPEAQRDRFSVKTSMGYPDVAGELSLLEKRASRRSLAPTVDPVVTPDAVRNLQDLAEDVTVDESVRQYMIFLARETRSDPRTEIGVSPRGIQRVFEATRARAVIDGRDYVTPQDVKRLAHPAMAHRVVLTTEANVQNVDPHDVVADALARVEVPGVAPEADDDSTDAPAPGQPPAVTSDADDRPSDGSGTGGSRGGRDAGDRSDRPATGPGDEPGQAGSNARPDRDAADHWGRTASNPTDGNDEEHRAGGHGDGDRSGREGGERGRDGNRDDAGRSRTSESKREAGERRQSGSQSAERGGDREGDRWQWGEDGRGDEPGGRGGDGDRAPTERSGDLGWGDESGDDRGEREGGADGRTDADGDPWGDAEGGANADDDGASR